MAAVLVRQSKQESRLVSQSPSVSGEAAIHTCVRPEIEPGSSGMIPKSSGEISFALAPVWRLRTNAILMGRAHAASRDAQLFCDGG